MSTERGRDKNLQLLRVPEKTVTSKKMQYSTTKMCNPSPRKNWNARQRKYGHNMREHSPVIAAELQIVDRGKKARFSLKQDGSMRGVGSKSCLTTDELCVFGQITSECSLNVGSHYYYFCI